MVTTSMDAPPIEPANEPHDRTALAVFAGSASGNGPSQIGQESILRKFLSELAELKNSQTYVVTDPKSEKWVREALPDSDRFEVLISGSPGRDGLVETVDRTLESLLDAGYDSAMALAADTPGLGVEPIREARDQLLADDPTAVVGPAGDGGFYLLGINCYRPGLLDGVPFFVGDTCQVLLDRLEGLYRKRYVLGVLNDVDRMTDWLAIDRSLTESYQWIVELVYRLIFGRRRRKARRASDVGDRFPFLQRTFRSPPVLPNV